MLDPCAQRRGHHAFVAMSSVATLLLVGCSDEPVPVPVPGDPPEDFECGEDAHVSFDRVEPDSALADPGWLEICSVCPTASMDFWLGDRNGGSVPLEQSWAEGGVSLPSPH